MDNIKVAIRVRPLIGRESGMVNHWIVQDNTLKPTDAVGKQGTSYTFDRIFDELMTTYDVFDEVCKPIIAGAVQGFNGTIFAYGQSSSGKTFTMSGGAMQKGIITLSVEEIFATIEASHHREFLIRVAYMEIYNEKVTDLLSTEEKVIKIQEDQEKNIQVTGVKEELVSNSGDVLAIIQKGDNRRHMAETKQNDRSSRSHCIIRIIIESRENGDEQAVMVAHLNFVDLAGSEKAGENSGDRLREGCSINKSLLILGQVISKLSDGVSNQHISYRDSKLTRILQVSLGGNSKTAIIATITPASLDESHSTLRFASQAKKIKNKAMVNEVLSEAAMLKQYQKEIHHQQQLNELGKIENQDLKKSLEQMEAQINNLKKFVIQSGPTKGQVKRKRRETWCPGKNKRMSIFRPSASFAVEEDIFLSEMPPMDDLPESLTNDEDVPMGPTNVTTRKRSLEQIKSQEKRSTINRSPDAKTKQIMELEDKYETLLKEHARLQTEFNDMSTFHSLERETLEENIATLQGEKEVIKHECVTLSDEVIQTEHKLNIQTRRMTDCKNELENYRKSLPKEDGSPDTPDTAMLKLQQECDSLKETIRLLEEENASSKTDSRESTNTMQKLQQECDSLKETIRLLEEENVSSKTDSQESTNTMEKLQQECDSLQETIRLLEEENVSSKTDSQESTNTMQKLQQECSILKLQVEKLENERIELMKKVDIENNKMATLADEQSSMHDELTDVRYKIEQVPVLKDRCEKLEQEKESLFTELNLLKEEGKIKPEIQEIELQNLKETDSSLQQKLQQAEEEKMLLMSKVESLQSKCREQSMDNGMATMEEECNRLREMVKQFEEEKLTSKTEEANSNEADSNQAMQKLQEECSILKLQIEKLESEGIESVGGSETESNKIALLEEECEVLRATVKDLADERLNMQDELTDVGHRIEQLPIMKEKCEELVQEKESLLMEIASLKEIGNAGPEMQEVELQILREKASNLQEQLESVEEEKMQMTLKLESLQSEFQENPLDNERAKLEEECEVLRATVNDLADERLNMQEELRDVGVKIEQLPVLKGKYEELLQEKESLLNEISSLKEEGKAEVEIQELELQKLREKANALEEKLDQVEEEKTDLTSKLENLQSEDHNTLAVNSMSKLEEECERLRETIRQLKEEKLPSKTEEADSNEAIQKLQEECSALKLQIEKLESEKDKSLEETDTESNKNATLEEEYEILRITVKDLIDERLDMQDELTEAGMKIEQLPILKEKCEELVQKNDSLLTEISLLKEGKSGTEMQEVELQILREKANSLQEQLESVKEERHSLISRLETLQSELENKNVDNAMAALEEECEILRATVKDLADERLNMQDELKDVGHKIEELPMLKEKCEKLLQEKESLIEMSLKKENAGPEMQEVELQILREKASHLQEQLELAEEEKNSLISRVESLQNESPEKPVEECERLRETIRLLEEENASSKTQAADSNDVLQKLQEECSVLKLQVEKIGTDRGESVERTDNDNNKIATLEGECEVLRATVKDLADECLNMQEKLTGIEQLPILKEKYEELVQEKAALLSEISSLKEEGETELDKPELELQNLREKASSLQEQLELAEEEKTSLISRLENIKTECQEQPKDSVVTVMEEECERLRETVKKLEEQNLPPKTEAADSNEAMQKLQEECSILKLQIEKLESERVQSVEGSDTENNKIATLEEECEILRATVKDLADERLNIQDELTDAGVKLEQVPILKEKCEELVQEKESLLVEISSMKEERNNTKSEMEEKCEKFEQTNNLLTAEISHLKQTNMSLEVEKTENVSSLQQQLEEVLGEKVHLKSCLEVLEKDCKEKQIAEEKCVGLKGKVKDLTDECLNLQKEITDLGVKAEQVPILKEKCEELVQEKDLLIQEVSSLREGTTKMERQSFEVRNLGEKVSNLQLQLEQSEQETLHLNSQLKQLETERHEKTVEIETCKSCYESLALEKKYLDEKVENLGRELAERISQQNAESGRVCVLLEEMSDMQENISQSEKERNEMEMKLEKSISELQVTQNQERENAICAKNNEIDQLKAEISTLKVQMEMEPSQQGLSCSVNMDTSTPWAEEKMELLKKIDVLKIERVKHARLMSEVNKIKEDKKMLISYCNDLEKQQQKAVDESDMGKKLKAAEADADKYYDLHNKQQTQIEEQKNLLSKSQTDMENMKAQFRETEKKLTEMQQTTAKQWEEIGEKKMEIFSQNRTIEEFEAKKQKLVQQYEETIDMKDNRIKKLQVEIRRRDAETSYMEPSSKAQKGDNSTSKENMPGGVVDQYNVFMLEAKNLRLEREVTKLNKRLKAVEDNPVTKPCSCPFQELSVKFEQQSGEKQRLQKEFDELKKKHIIKVGSREIDTSTINVPDVKVPTANPTEYSRHDDQLLSESKRRPNTNYPRKPFSDNECKQQ